MWSRIASRRFGLTQRNLYETIKYEEIGKVGWITLNRPEKLNAMSGVTYKEIPEALKIAATSENVNVVAITGAGKFYTSGDNYFSYE
jgi:2-(1,2-epoxy-1,2-dihydrophenyl)acetyl-CoA isomerase